MIFFSCLFFQQLPWKYSALRPNLACFSLINRKVNVVLPMKHNHTLPGTPATSIVAVQCESPQQWEPQLAFDLPSSWKAENHPWFFLSASAQFLLHIPCACNFRTRRGMVSRMKFLVELTIRSPVLLRFDGDGCAPATSDSLLGDSAYTNPCNWLFPFYFDGR